MMKTSAKIILPLIALALILPITVRAFEVKSGSAVNVNQDQTVDGNLYAAGSTILIDGTVKGDVICAGQSVTISGQVEGDVICAAQSVNVFGAVGGSVRLAANNININNRVGRNVMAFAAAVVLGSKADVGMDVLLGTASANINGKVGGNLHGAAAMANIGGQIAKNVSLQLDGDQQVKKATLVVTPDAKIGGNLEYTSAFNAAIAKKEAVGGQIKRQVPLVSPGNGSIVLFGLTKFWLWFNVVAIFGALVIGLLLVILFKDKVKRVADEMVHNTAQSFGWGALMLLVTPFVLVFLAITVIGLPLALILGLLWLAWMMIAKVLAAVFVGLLFAGHYRYRKGSKNGTQSDKNLVVFMIVGVVVTYALFSIPLLGCLFILLAKIWAMGAMWLTWKKSYYAVEK